jgi:spermidine synthase
VAGTNGQLVLDSARTNYSHGSSQRILRIELLQIGFDSIVKMNHILILGVAGGSVIKTFNKEVGYKNKNNGVEIDSSLIAIAKTYFELDKVPNLKLILDDAFEFDSKTKDTYDLIIINIFQDTKTPTFFFEDFFVDLILDLSKLNGLFFFNTTCLTEADDSRNKAYLKLIDKKEVQMPTIPRIEFHNLVIIAEKLRNHTAS